MASILASPHPREIISRRRFVWSGCAQPYDRHVCARSSRRGSVLAFSLATLALDFACQAQHATPDNASGSSQSDHFFLLAFAVSSSRAFRRSLSPHVGSAAKKRTDTIKSSSAAKRVFDEIEEARAKKKHVPVRYAARSSVMRCHVYTLPQPPPIRAMDRAVHRGPKPLAMGVLLCTSACRVDASACRVSWPGMHTHGRAPAPFALRRAQEKSWVTKTGALGSDDTSRYTQLASGVRAENCCSPAPKCTHMQVPRTRARAFDWRAQLFVPLRVPVCLSRSRYYDWRCVDSDLCYPRHTRGACRPRVASSRTSPRVLPLARSRPLQSPSCQRTRGR